MSDKKEQTVTELAAETLTGDIRDFLLGHMRNMQKPWAQMSESEQRSMIALCEKSADSLVRGAVSIVSARNFERVHVHVGKFAVKDGMIKAEFSCQATHDNLLSIADADGAVLVLASAEAFEGQRGAANPDPDEPSLPIEDDEDSDDEDESAAA